MKNFYMPHNMILQLGITDICDLDCIMCPLCPDNKPFHGDLCKGFSDPEQIQAIIDEYEAIPFEHRTVLLQWFGESTLHTDYFSIVKYILSKNIHTVSLLTNGYSTTAQQWNTISELSNLNNCYTQQIVFHFSLDAVSDETYVNIKKRSGLKRIVSMIKDVIRFKAQHQCSKVSVIVQFIEMKENTHEKQQFIQLWSAVFQDNGLSADIVYAESDVCTTHNTIYIKPLNELRAVADDDQAHRIRTSVTFTVHAPGFSQLYAIGNWNAHGAYDNEYLTGFSEMISKGNGIFEFNTALCADSRPYYFDVFADNTTLDPNTALLIHEFYVKNEQHITISLSIDEMKHHEIEYSVEQPVHYGDNSICGFLFSNVTVHHSGAATVCCSDTDLTLMDQNVYEHGLSSFFQSTALHDLRMKHVCGERHMVSTCHHCLFSSSISDEYIIEYLRKTGEYTELKKYLLKLKNMHGMDTMLYYWALSYKLSEDHTAYIKKLKQGKQIMSGGMCEQQLHMAQ